MFSMLQYDIPTEAGVSNPSNRLRRFCIRTSKSVWVVRDDLTPWNLLNEWDEAGVTWDLAPFSTEGADRVLAMCRKAVEADIKDIQKRCQKSLEKAAKKFEADKRPDAQERYEKSCKTITKRAEKKIDSATRACKIFRLEFQSAIGEASECIRNLLAVAHQRAALYASMTEQVAGTRMDVAAQQNDVPPQILADFIEDTMGQEMSEMQAAFGSLVYA